MQARVQIAARGGGVFVSGELVDVSAGGLRARAATDARIAVGTPVDVELLLPQGEYGERPPGCDLRGAGVVVRIEASHDAIQAALRFTGPLQLREPFSQLLVF